MDSTAIAPSGTCLPAFLRRKWKDGNEALVGGPPPVLSISELHPHIARAEKSRVMHRIFTAKEIEERMQKISKQVLIDIQKQILRGEESYYEETNAHGNLFRGWDAYVDSRDAVGSAGLSSVPQGGSRRIPADNRWFASSCKSISRPGRPPSSLWNRPQSHGPLGAMSSGQLKSSAAVAVGTTASGAPDVKVPEIATSSQVSGAPLLNDVIQADDAREQNIPAGLAASLDSSSTKPEAVALHNDEAAAESSLKRKRQEENDEDTGPGRDAKKQPADGEDKDSKCTPANDAGTSEEITEAPKTPVTARKEERTPKRTDSQQRRSSRRKAV
jgi:Histone acetyltransferase subunit NuA4